MAPSGKRKRPERTDSIDNTGRPSPHRPQSLSLANGQQRDQQQNNNARSSRRGSRNAGRGAPSTPNSPSVAQPSPSTMPPPAPVPPPSRPQAQPSTPSTPSTPAAPSNQQPPQSQPKPSKAPKTNGYLTQERVGAWSTEGRAAVVEAGAQAQAEGDMLTLSIVFEELVQGCLDEVMSVEEIGTTVRDILAASASDAHESVSLLLDMVSTLTETAASHALLKPMLVATGIDTSRMRGELGDDLLVALGLVRSSFTRVAIRRATHALYRQSNYNLLREETEGYSKLITEYFTTVNNKPPNEEVVADTFQRVKALIGAFDLDVGRVLDVTLDVFANLLVKHNRFFIKFLRLSSWWPEHKVPHGIEWEELVVDALPRWASPGFALWHYSDEEKKEQLLLREQRDQGFWKRVDEIGIKAYFELGARRITSGAPSIESTGDTPMADTAEGAQKKQPESADFEEIQKWSQQWMAETQTLPPSGNRIAAQLLGFKLRFYASDARDAHDLLPNNLIHLTALLIKVGFVSLADVYPHLYPSDEDMPAHRDKLIKEKNEKDEKLRGISNNALAMAGALPDDTLPAPAPVARLRESESKAPSKSESERGTPPRTEEDTKDKLPEPMDQKVALLRSLLLMGAIPEALFILSRFPWLLDVYPDLHTYMFRLAHHSLSKVYESTRPFSPEEFPVVAKQGPPVSTNAQATARASDYVGRRTLRWPNLEEKDAGEGIDYRFYWDDWADNVPICQNVDDVFRLCNTLLKFVGLECGKDTVLITELVRIGKKSLTEDSSPTNMRRWTTLSATFLGPALSFTGRNPGVVNEAWELFKHFDTATRYSIYQTWFSGTAKRQPALKAKFAEVNVQINRIFRRINTENTREMGRAIAKPAYACPGVVFERALATAEQYSNMTEPLVECCRYLTYLGYDCLNWTFINSFKDSRSVTQADGMLTKPWLKNAAFFIGKAYRRYSLMDPTPILQFVTDQLLRGKLFTLAILEQLITSMAGIGPVLSVTESQVHGLSAGPLLRAFTLEHYLGDKRHQAKSTAKRLLKCLREAGLAAQILVALALELEQYVYREEFEVANTPLKVISTNLDNLHSNFGQYLDFLRTFLSIQEFDTVIPGLVELMSEFGVSPGLAFTICRASFAVQVNAARAEWRETSKKAKSESASPPKVPDAASERLQVNGDTTMGGVEDTPAVNGAITESKDIDQKEPKPSEDTEMKDIPTAGDIDEKDSPAAEKTVTPNGSHQKTTASQGHSNAEIDALADRLRTSMPDTYGNHVCLNFFVTFWQLSLVDVFTVTSMKEVKEYTAAWKFYAEKATRVPYDRRDVSTQAVEKRKAEIKGYNDQSLAFRTEAGKTLEAAINMREHLQGEMHRWFEGIPMVDARSEELHDTILQDCFLPRILLSSQDAQYASAMLKFMHEIGVPGFRTMKLLDQLFKQKVLTGIIFMCSSRESQNLGRFLNDVLKELDFWHSSQANYTKFAQGQRKSLPGFGRTFNTDRTPATFLDYEDFRRVLFKWHSQLFRALETCFKSDEYMQIRNAINILKAIAQNFPKVDFMGKGLHQIVQSLSQNDSRDDLKLAALSLLGDLKKSEKLWVASHAFHHNPNARPTTNTPTAATHTGLEQPRTPQPSESSTPSLNATAAEFNPRAATINGTSRSAPTATNGHGADPANNESRRGGEPSADSEIRTTERESSRPAPAPPEQRPSAQPQRQDGNATSRTTQPDTRSTTAPVPLSAPPVPRPASRGSSGNPTPSSRVPHTLPPRPEPQPPRSRPPERTNDRQIEYNAPSRHDARSNAPRDYGRPDRAGDAPREPFPERRDMSPGRRPRGRTPERRDPGWGPREPGDVRDARDYHDDRSMRPPRDIRGAPPGYHSRDPRDPRDPRDARDMRDPRDRGDLRGPPPPLPIDGRARLHSHPPLNPDDSGGYRRDLPPRAHQSADRSSNLPPRPSGDRAPSNVQSAGIDRPALPNDRIMMNPDRAALFSDDRLRNDPARSDRDNRHDRGSRPQSPRRGHERPPPSHQGRGDAVRDVRDDRATERPIPNRTPPHNLPQNRDGRDEPTGGAPTGPRGGRNDSQRVTRDIFMPNQPSSRTGGHQAQDPNYGRLNPPTETIPSGPRSLTSDRRDSGRRESIEQPHPPTGPAPPVAPAAAQTNRVGIHPSRLQNISAPTLQTDVVNAPSGPRGAVRTPIGPAAPSPSSVRGPPTGPAATERNARGQDRTAIRAINSLLSQNHAPANTLGDPNSGQGPPIRGRGGARASGLVEAPNTSSPVRSSSHPGTPNGPRPDGPGLRGDRAEHASTRGDNRPPDDGRHESRGHRESGRRSERSGRQRSRSPDRGDRRADERGSRNGPSDRGSRNDEQERGSDRDRGSGRDKRGSDRDGRRERDREGDHSTREGRDGRDRRDRSGRDDARGSGRGEDPGSRRGGPPVNEPAAWPNDGRGDARGGDTRGRGGNERREERGDRRRDDGRKRGPGEDPPGRPHDQKRTRRSNPGGG